MTMDKLFIPSVILSLLSLLALSEAVPRDALITHLPGFNGSFPSQHYSGYVTVDEKLGKNLFYYFVVSEGNSSKDPVVLWLNGGPGCSSFDGFVYEHGPFNFQAAKNNETLPRLHLNPYSWSKVSNIIYLDSPAGVGLSYSESKDGYITGDKQTASDTHAFLLKWFEQYPEFLSNPFYISGESYAGVHVPTLASEVVKGLDNGIAPALNFKGYMVGNGITVTDFDDNALLPFAHGMGLIPDELFQEVSSACYGKYSNFTDENCTHFILKFWKDLDDLNIYDILKPCYHGTAPEARNNRTANIRLPSSFRELGKTDRPLPVRMRMFGRAWPLRAPVREGHVPTWPDLHQTFGVSCMNDEVAYSWLNNHAVRKALHAKQENLTWELCTGKIAYTCDTTNMIEYHKNLTARGYRALIYSEAWTRSLGSKIVDEWRHWLVDLPAPGYNDHVAGYDASIYSQC